MINKITRKQFFIDTLRKRLKFQKHEITGNDLISKAQICQLQKFEVFVIKCHKLLVKYTYF